MNVKFRLAVVFGLVLAAVAVAAETAAQASQEVTITSNADWLPFDEDTFIREGSALDFSAFRGTGSTAGEYGRVVAVGDHFEFERRPGVVQRFYGANLSFSANFHSLEDARKLMRQFARLGYNTVRIHHFDDAVAVKDLSRTELVPEQMEKLDALILACIENGIYVTTDLYVSRRVPWQGAGLDKPDNFNFKELVQAHEGAYSNYLAFARNFLTHVNKYTGRSYAEEPAIAWLSLVNEGNLGNWGMSCMGRHECFRTKYFQFLREMKKKKPERWAKVPERMPGSMLLYGQSVSVEANDPKSAEAEDALVNSAYELFLVNLELSFAKRTTDFLRKIGAKLLLTNMNCWHYPVTRQLARDKGYDYVDDHMYYDLPRFQGAWKASNCKLYHQNRNQLVGQAPGVPGNSFRRILDKPFTQTEWNYCFPCRYRAMSGFVMGALAARQGWSGLWRYSWSHSSDCVKAPEKMMLWNFDICGDPAGFASERAGVCLFLRQDLATAKTAIAAVIPPKVATDPAHRVVHMDCSWLYMGWSARIGNLVADAAPEGMRTVATFPENFRGIGYKTLMSRIEPVESNEDAVWVDTKGGNLTVTTDRTCGGYWSGGAKTLGALTCSLDAPATAWMSSLDGQPIGQSRHLLFTHLTETQNSGIVYTDSTRTEVKDFGKPPLLMRVAKADVSLRVPSGTWQVFALASSGERRREVPSTCADGCLVFRADVAGDPQHPTYLYELVEKGR